MAEIHITILSGVSAGDVFRFDLSEDNGNGAHAFTIGRSPECELVLQQPEVSRRHASISRREGAFFLCDLGSAHGTQHMGFPVQPGDEGARRLSSGDEFKISELLFRVIIPEDLAAKEKQSNQQKPAQADSSSATDAAKRKRLIRLALPVLLILLGGLYLFSGETKGGLPPQHSNDPIYVPSYVVSGYYPGSGSDRRDQKDSSHLDKAQFELPSSDLLVEYELFAEAPVEVRLDETRIETVSPTGGSWQYRSSLLRDLALGRPRRLIFDNTDYPRAANSKPQPFKKWGVRNVRATPIPQLPGVQPGFVNAMQASLGLAQSLDKSADGLYYFVRGLQASALQLMQEQRIDAIDYVIPIDIASDGVKSDSASIQQQLNEILLQNSGSTGAESSREILRLTTKLIGQFDGEIWRRVNNRIVRAKTSVKVQNSIEAHDQLLSAMNMFPPESDYRWAIVNRMYLDNKVVPKVVREHPDKYRPQS